MGREDVLPWVEPRLSQHGRLVSGRGMESGGPTALTLRLLCQVVKRLPKTRSGKVMRRLLRKIVTGQAQDLGDTTTLEDPSVISEILSAYQEYKDKRGAL